MQRSAKLTLAILALVCTLPIIASYLAFYVWQPQTTMNYGELIQPAPLPDARLNGLAGQPGVDRGALNGHWTLVYAGSGDCRADCGEALYAMRQSRLAQGKEMGRVARLWLVTDDVTPTPEVIQQHPELRVARGHPAWIASLPAAECEAHLFLVDPLGNVMMRFPAQPDVKLVIKDLQRLLKYSGLG